jgi:Na+/phosphate symporter
MSMSREEAKMVAHHFEEIIGCLKEVAESLLERHEKNAAKIVELEQEIKRLKSEPRTSLSQRLRARGQA